jgi:hypothetical protein
VGTPEVVAGIAAVAAAGTGVGTYVLGARRLTHERGLADRADAREVLAAAAVDLWETKQTMRDQYRRIEITVAKGERPPEFPDDVVALERRRDAVERSLHVLRIRFGEAHPVVTTYADAWEAIKGLLSLYVSAYGESGLPEGAYRAPSLELVAEKEHFGSSRAARWFGREAG